MNFSAYSIKNPLVAILLFSLLVLLGVFGFRAMKVQNFPDIDFPVIITTITLNGATPDQLENDIAKKVENKLANIEGVKNLRTTLQTGAVTVLAEFEIEKDSNEALDDVRSAVSEVQGDLPAAADSPIISKASTSGFPVVTYSVSSDGMTAGELSWFVDDALTRRLSNIQGVGSIARIGGIERQIHILPKPDLLSSLGLPISQLSSQIYAKWQDTSGGEAKVGNQTQTIRVRGMGDNMQDLAGLQIMTATGVVELGQIADIRDSHAEITSVAEFQGKNVVAFNITRSKGAGEVAVVSAVDEEIAKIERDFEGIKIEKITDYAKPVEETYHGTLRMLIEGCVLAVIVVFLFLRDWRATLVAATALPLSIIPTFFVMWVFGFSLNMISLLALTLVIGVLVDDAIVEIENIVRHLGMGKTPYEAAMEAADEIGLAVVATTFTLIAVFLPTAFMSGVVGQFFRQFGWTAAISVFISLVVARLITPMMAAYMLKPIKHHDKPTSAIMKIYLNIVKWTLSNRLITMVATFAFFMGSLSLAGLLPTAFIPVDEANQTQVSIELTPDATLEDTKRIAAMAKDKVMSVEGVSQVLITVGGGQSTGDPSSIQAGSVNQAALDVILHERGDRPDKLSIESAMNAALKDVPSARFSVGIEGSGAESGYGFSVMSSQKGVLDEVVKTIIKEARQLGSVANVTSNTSLPKPELTVTPKPLMMADKGVTTTDIATTLRVATMGDYDQALPKLNLNTRQIPIVIRLSDDDKRSLDELGRLVVPSAKGEVRLHEVADLHFGTGESSVSRLNRERAVKITVFPKDGVTVGELVSDVKAMPILHNLPNGVQTKDEGQAENMAELFEGFIIAMSVGIFCILGALILLFHRLLQPFTILMALPLSIGGAFVGLILTGASLSMPAMIGFILLMGIATKNSILLVDYAIIAQDEEGLARFDAVMDACHKRARPIVMTTIAMGAGMVPLLISFGDVDTSFSRPMAAAVLGGLITSTFLSLVVIPVVYTLMDDVGSWFTRRRVTY